MTGNHTSFFLCLLLTTVTSTRHHHRSNLCQPCAGSSLSNLGRVLNVTDYGRHCFNLHEIHVRLLELKSNVSTETHEMINNIFDGDVSYIDENPLVFSGPCHLSSMALTYNKLVYLHVVMKLLETHPDKHACAVTTSSIADRLPFCHLRSIIPSMDSLEFMNVCSEDGYIDMNRCLQIQRYAYRVLRTASNVLHDIHRDVRRFQTQYGCPRY